MYLLITQGLDGIKLRSFTRWIIPKDNTNQRRDADIVFEIMRALSDEPEMQEVVLVSGDGDYKKLVEYLIGKKRFKKILFPNAKFASSLYKDVHVGFKTILSDTDVRKKIEYKNTQTKEKASLGS